MCYACDNAERMPKMIQIRNVPDDLHRRLKIRAAEQGLSLSDYLRIELSRIAEQPTLEEMLARLRTHETVDLPPDEEPAAVIRRMRESA